MKVKRSQQVPLIDAKTSHPNVVMTSLAYLTRSLTDMGM